MHLHFLWLAYFAVHHTTFAAPSSVADVPPLVFDPLFPVCFITGLFVCQKLHTQTHTDVSLCTLKCVCGCLCTRISERLYIRNSGYLCLTVERKRAKQMEEMRSQRSESESAPDQMTEEEEEFVAEVQGNKLNWLKEKVCHPH
jgi:hypothetical protein